MTPYAAGDAARVLNLLGGMERVLAIVATLVAGGLVAFQPPANALLSRITGDLAAAFTSLCISTLIIGVLLVVAGQVGDLRGLSAFEPVHVLGGVAGAAIVFVSLVTVRPLGAAGVAAILVVSQLAISAVLDHAGSIGLDRIELGAERVIGVALLIVGTVLVTSR